MTRSYESFRETDDQDQSPSQHSDQPSAKLLRLRAEHGLKASQTAEQLGKDDTHAKVEWQTNDQKATHEVVEERTMQPWRPGNKIPLTREYRHTARREGISAGTPEDAKNFMRILKKDYTNLHEGIISKKWGSRAKERPWRLIAASKLLGRKSRRFEYSVAKRT